MKDRVVQHPSRYRLVKVAGTTDIYDLVPAPGTVTEEGTYINKTTLLDDDTAAMLWSEAEMPEEPTPNLAFQLLRSIFSDTVPVTRGGTGLTSIDVDSFLVGNGESAVVPKTISEVKTLLEIPASLPPGTILWYAKTTAPTGFLICNGAAVNRTTYAALYAAIGTKFGTGNGSTTFQIPDLRARFIRGAGTYSSYSATFGTNQEATYVGDRVSNPSSGHNAVIIGNYDKSGSTYTGITTIDYSNASSGAGTYRYTRPYNLALTPIIKF